MRWTERAKDGRTGRRDEKTGGRGKGHSVLLGILGRERQTVPDVCIGQLDADTYVTLSSDGPRVSLFASSKFLKTLPCFVVHGPTSSTPDVYELD